MATPRKTSDKKPSAAKPARKASIKPAPAKNAPAKDKAAPKKKIVTKPKAPEKTTTKPKPAPLAGKKSPAKKPVMAVREKIPEPLPVRPAKPAKPAKPAVDAELIKAIREALVQQRQRLHSLVQSTAQQMAEREGDLPDVSDRASEGYGDELAAGLMAIEAGHLDEIEAAIRRIDDGSYGICLDCGKAIPRKRLEVLPFAQRCLGCKGASERRSHALDGLDEEEAEEEHDAEEAFDNEPEARE